MLRAKCVQVVAMLLSLVFMRHLSLINQSPLLGNCNCSADHCNDRDDNENSDLIRVIREISGEKEAWLSDGRLRRRAAEGRRTPGCLRGNESVTNVAKRPGVRQPSGALGCGQN